MKILAFGDLHGDIKTLNKIIKKSKSVDVVVCAGDLSNFSMDLEIVLNKLKKIEKPLLIINGNHELDYELKKLCKKYKFIFIHKTQYNIANYSFVGFGGGGFSQIDKEFESWAKKFKKRKDKKIVLVTHAPIFNTKLDFLQGLGHVGNKSMRKFVDKIKPILVVCGHLHENFNVTDEIKKTKLINPGKEGKILTI
ncbi:MAG: metallophosphoesterase [Candidatus Nanoarchaeia archaeon]|jgi:hypothetical protein|nr:metallophosphoesterase [Candidatus Nanoarchaeia archaeon]|tara:strand:+ start:20208 stop:20792 length:585 start_codon:yes stop_codon:yes gene_type:complete